MGIEQEVLNRRSLAHGSIRILCAPLIIRGGSVYEVWGITGLSRRQIYEQRRALRANGQLPPVTPEYLNDIYGEAYRKKPQPGTEAYKDEQKRFALASRLIGLGFIAHETTQWERLHALYQSHQGTMPDDFATRLRLEAFLVVHEQARRGNQRPLIRFGEALQVTNPALFQDPELRAEHQFIMAAVAAEESLCPANHRCGSGRQKLVLVYPEGGGPVETMEVPA